MMVNDKFYSFSIISVGLQNENKVFNITIPTVTVSKWLHNLKVPVAIHSNNNVLNLWCSRDIYEGFKGKNNCLCHSVFAQQMKNHYLDET